MKGGVFLARDVGTQAIAGLGYTRGPDNHLSTIYFSHMR